MQTLQRRHYGLHKTQGKGCAEELFSQYYLSVYELPESVATLQRTAYRACTGVPRPETSRFDVVVLFELGILPTQCLTPNPMFHIKRATNSYGEFAVFRGKSTPSAVGVLLHQIIQTDQCAI